MKFSPLESRKWMMWLAIITLIIAAILVGCSTLEESELTSTETPALQRGINMAGDFEVEPRGAWGTPIEAHFFELAAEAGFDHVRVPIRWSTYTGAAPTYTIAPAFFAEVDWLLEQAARVGLTIVIDVHHFEELDADPNGNRDRLRAIWRQVGERYAEHPPTVVFEILNEPTGAFNTAPGLWNEILADALTTIRESNPDRTVIIGPVGFNHPNRLPELILPDDANLVATIHSYDPTQFTNQGAPWFDPPPPTGKQWRPTDMTLDFLWRNDSWDSRVTQRDDGFNIEFDRQYAAFAGTRLSREAVAFNSLLVEADREFAAIAICNVHADSMVIEFEAAVSVDSGVVYSADISHCGWLESIAIQLDSETLIAPTLKRIDLCPTQDAPLEQCDRLIVTSADAIDRQMRRAADWANANGVALYLGEFGVYDHPPDPVDETSRIAWITTMRRAAERHNIGWAYFELSNEFGVYNHATNEWHEPMLSALFE